MVLFESNDCDLRICWLEWSRYFLAKMLTRFNRFLNVFGFPVTVLSGLVSGKGPEDCWSPECNPGDLPISHIVSKVIRDHFVFWIKCFFRISHVGLWLLWEAFWAVFFLDCRGEEYRLQGQAAWVSAWAKLLPGIMTALVPQPLRPQLQGGPRVAAARAFFLDCCVGSSASFL